MAHMAHTINKRLIRYIDQSALNTFTRIRSGKVKNKNAIINYSETIFSISVEKEVEVAPLLNIPER